METWEAVMISQLPLVIMAVFYLFELRRIREALETIAKKFGRG